MRAQPQVSKSLAQVSDYSTVVSLQFSINFQEILNFQFVQLLLSCQDVNSTLFIFIYLFFNFKIFNSYMRSQT